MKDMKYLNHTINQLDLIDIYKILYLIYRIYIVSSTQETFNKIVNILGPKTNLNIKEIIQNLLCDHKIKLEINNRYVSGKSLIVRNLNTLLNNS